MADAKTNLAAAVLQSGGSRCPLLVDIRKSAGHDAEARHYLSGQAVEGAFTAVALLVEASPWGRTMGNVYLRVARPGVPMQLFNDEDAAIHWLDGNRA